MGTKATLFGLYPTFLMKVEVSLTISPKRSSLHWRDGQTLCYSVRKKSETDLGRVHLIDSNDELSDTKGKGEESVLASLTVLGDTSFEFTCTTSNDKNGAVGLRCSRNHVLDEVTVTRGVDDLELKEVRWKSSLKRREHRSHTVTMNLGVSNFQRAISIVIPRSRSAFSLSSTHARKTCMSIEMQVRSKYMLTILEGTLAEFSSFLLEFFNCTLIDTTALVDQVTSGGRFAGIDVTNDCNQGRLIRLSWR